VGPQVFHVLTEFRFDIAHAVAESKVLQTEVGKISNAAENVLDSLQSMARGVLSSFGLLGGAAGFLYAAVQASEKFEASQRKLANVMLSNQDVFGSTGITFKQAMMQSEKIMDSVVHKAQQFGLDPTELLNQTNSIAPMLLSHGLDNADMTRSMDISRGLLKSAPTLGIDPGMLGGQLINLVLGRGVDGNNTLFQRLSSETQPFKDNKITNSKQYMALAPEKRIELLTKSLLQFGSNADILKGNMESLNGQMTIFKSLVYGAFSVFRSIGKAIATPLKMMLFEVNKWLAGDGKKIIDMAAGLFRRLLADPKKLLITLMQLSKLKQDLSWAGRVMQISGALLALSGVLGFFGIQIGAGGLLRSGLLLLGNLASLAGSALGSAMPYLATFASFLARFVIAPLALALIIFQGISRGIAAAKITDALFFAKNAVKITEFMGKMAKAIELIFLPINLAIEGIGHMVEWLLSTGVISQWFVDHLTSVGDFFIFLGKIMLGFMSVLSGITNFVMELIYSLEAFLTTFNTDAFKGLGDSFMEGFNRMWNSYLPPRDAQTDTPVSGHTTNIDKIEIRNEFKEQMEPDRIAFTLKEQLLKAALNPGQAAGRSTRAALVGN
jgi:hypothetical protein